MGHAANSTLRNAEKVVKGLSLDLLEKSAGHGDHIDCPSCLMGKQKRLPFPSHARHRATHIAELIHTDVWGPVNIATLSGEAFFVAFTDDFSRFSTVYLMKHKSEVYSHLQRYIAWIENQSGHRVKRLRSDNGGEYISNAIIEFLRSKGIEHQLTMPYTAEQNGVAERGHQTIATRALSAHHQSGFPRSFWGHAILNSAYIKNFLPSSAIDNRTPFELFYGELPDVSHLRPFGCLAYAHIPDDNRHKYEFVSRRFFLLGHVKDAGYLLWDPATRQTVRSRNVHFDESIFYGTPNSVVSPLVELYNQRTLMQQSTSALPHPLPTSEDTPEITLTGPSTVPVGVLPDSAPLIPEPSQPFPQSNNNILPVTTTEDPVETAPSPELRRSTRQRIDTRPAVPRSVAIPTKSVPVQRRWTYVPVTIEEEIDEEQSSGTTLTPNVIEHSARQASSMDSNKIDGRKLPPKTIAAARSSTDFGHWESAMTEELASLEEKGVGVLTPLPPGRKAVGSRWVYSHKYDENGQIARHKARLVAQGFSQIEGLDYTDTFAPVAKYDTVRALLSMVAKFDLELDQMDVKTAFLNGQLDEEIYMRQPPGFEDPEHPDWVWKLLKAIYGLKQAGRQWNKTLDDFLRKEGFNFVRSEADYSLYVLRKGDKTIWLLVYVDDMLLASNCRGFLDGFKLEMSKHFEMKDLGEARHFLGMHITRDRSKKLLTINQSSFLEQILSEAQMSDCRPVSTPMVPNISLTKASAPLTQSEVQQFAHMPYARVVGELNFAMRVSRPDIAYAVSTLSKFLSNPGIEHYHQLHHLLRYIRGTTHHSLSFGLSDQGLVGYSDSDFASDKDDSRSIGGYVYYLFGTPISWRSQKQSVVATSSTEAEYIALSNAAREQIHLTQLLHDFGLDSSLILPTVLYGDNNGSRALTKNPQFHDRAKHIRVRYHFIRDLVNDGTIKIPYISTHDMVADIFTKSLPRKLFRNHRYSLALRSLSNETLAE
jgi:transposase InsO family protein